MVDALGDEDPDRFRLHLARHEGDLVAATIVVRVGAHAWYSYGASSTEKRDVRGSNAVQWAMIRDAIAAGADVYDLRGITPTLDADDRHVGLIQFKVGTGGEAVEYAGEWDLPLNRPLYKAFDLYMSAAGGDPMSLILTVDGDRWRAHLRSVAEATPGLVPVAKGNGYGFTLGRLARKAGWLRDRGSASTPSPSGPTTSCPRSPRATTAACWCSPRGARSAPPSSSTPRSRGGSSTPSAAPRTWPPARPRSPSARFVLELLDQHAPPRHDRPRAVGRGPRGRRPPRREGRGRRPAPAAGAPARTSREVERLLNDVVAAELPTTTIWVSHLTTAELADAARGVPRPHLPPPRRHRPVARRPRRAAGHRDGPRRARGPARRRLRLPRPHRAAGRAPPGRQRRHRPRHRPGGPQRRRRPRRRAAIVARGGLEALGSCARRSGSTASSGSSPSRRTCRPRCCSCRTAPRVPAVGDVVDVRVRYTATAFDRVVVS